jgi:hypothetical protein
VTSGIFARVSFGPTHCKELVMGKGNKVRKKEVKKPKQDKNKKVKK